MARVMPWQLIGAGLVGALILNALPAAAMVTSAATTHPAPTGSASINLTCYGEVSIRQTNRSATSKQAYQGYVEVRLTDSDARIRLPQGLGNTGDNGWYKVKYLKTSDSDIIGNAIVTYIDKPFFRVDRISGRINISGLGGSFSGECRKNDG